VRLKILHTDSEIWADMLKRADQVMASAEFSPVKSGTRILAGFILNQGRPNAFIKRFTSDSWSRGIIERLRGSRAARSLKAASLLTSAGFSCPKLIGAAEMHSSGAIRSSYLVTEPLASAQTFSIFIDRRQSPSRQTVAWRTRILAMVAAEVRRMHDAGIFTSDLQETNLMLEERNNETRIYFVDLDGFRRRSRISQKNRRRNLVQLDRSVGRFLNRTERLHFLYNYLGGRPDRSSARALIADLLSERRRKDQQYRRRRARRGDEQTGLVEAQSAQD
jgi:tRNA A-37 threonylcarbamoyl transferase component Bud32